MLTLAIAIATLLDISLIGMEQFQKASPMKNSADRLTADQLSRIRHLVYDFHPIVAAAGQGKLQSKRVLTIPNELQECYKVNPIETLTLLAEIVRGGAPKDSILAAAYMTALDGDPVAAVLTSRIAHDFVDRMGKDSSLSLRPVLIAEANKFLKMAVQREKEKQENKKMSEPVPPSEQ